MKRTVRLPAGILAGILAASTLSVPSVARASEDGRRNTALALGAAAAYLLATQKNKTAGIATGLGAAWAYKQYDDSVQARRRRDRYYGGRYDGDYRYGSRYDSRYNDRYGDRYYRDRDDDGRRYYRSGSGGTPPGWSRGKKKGWHKNGKRDCDD